MGRTFNKFWLVLGLAQLLFLSACQQSAPLADSGAETPLPSNDESAQINEATRPVRISRAFFEGRVTGTVKENNEKEYETTTSWHESAPTAPPPIGPVLADFREHRGCAYYEKTNGIQLCFNVVPDISSLGVNEKEVAVEGICDGSYERTRLVNAVYSEGMLTVNFLGLCKGDPRVVQLTLRQAETR